LIAKASNQFSQARLDELLANAERQFKATYLELITHVAGSIDTAEVAALMESGNLGQAIVTTETLALGLSGIWADIFHEGADEAGQFIQDAQGVAVRFDVVNQRAVSAIRQAQLRLIREVSDPQRDLFRDIISRGVAAGTNPRDVARELRESLGLTRYQEGVVQSYRDLLERNSAQALQRELRDGRFDQSVRAAISQDRPIPPATIDRMVDRYRQRWVNFRAETIARTEGLRASSQGIQEGFLQAVETGHLKHEEVVRTWLTRHDGRSREWHLEMDQQKRGLTQPFQSGLGNSLMEPRDPTAPAEDTINCRCRVTYRLS
jgi:hypothetical protein